MPVHTSQRMCNHPQAEHCRLLKVPARQSLMPHWCGLAARDRVCRPELCPAQASQHACFQRWPSCMAGCRWRRSYTRPRARCRPLLTEMRQRRSTAACSPTCSRGSTSGCSVHPLRMLAPNISTFPSLKGPITLSLQPERNPDAETALGARPGALLLCCCALSDVQLPAPVHDVCQGVAAQQ